LLLVLLGLLLGLQVAASLSWRMEHDTPLLHYAAWLMNEHGVFPYRDLFETSMPGALGFHWLVVKLFGTGDLAFRLVDLALLALLSAATYLFLRRFGRRVAWAAPLLFGLIYLGDGQSMSLQRDYLGVIPVAFALLLLPSTAGRALGRWRFAALGLLFAAAVLVKPQHAIALPVLFVALHRLRSRGPSARRSDLLASAAVCAAAFTAPLALVAVWLAANSALGSFLDIALRYLPLHNALSGGYETLSGSYRLLYLVGKTLRLGGSFAFALCAFFAAFRFFRLGKRPGETRIAGGAVFLCALAYAIYPALGGKFWNYHYMPFLYFVALALSLVFAEGRKQQLAGRTARARALLPAVLFFVAIFVQLDLPGQVRQSVTTLRQGRAAQAPKGGRVDEIAAWLSARLEPGDHVQPLDWTGGAIHAMLLARAPLATSFLYDYHFHHHVSAPYIADLRHRFLRELSSARPSFVIEVETMRPWPKGKDTSSDFPALREFITANYAPAMQGEGYTIHELHER